MADARLALLPSAFEQPKLVLASDKLGERARVRRLEPGLRGALADHPPGRHRFGKPLELMGPNILKVEGFADQQACCGADHHLARRRHFQQTGRQIRRLPGHCVLLRRGLADNVADHHLSRSDADAGRKRLAVLGLQVGYRVYRGHARPHRPLRLVLVGTRPAEEGEHPVAEKLGDVAFVPGDSAGRRVLIAAHHLAQVFRVEPAREFRRADQVAEHDRELPALGFG